MHREDFRGKRLEYLEGKLIHWVNLVEVIDDEEEE